MFRDAAAHVRIVRDVVLAERLFYRQRVRGEVGHIHGELAVARAAVEHFALDRRGDEVQLVLLVRALVQVHPRRFERGALRGVEQPAAQKLRLRRERGGQRNALTARARGKTQPLEVARRLVRVQFRLAADEHARDAFRRRKGGADALRRLPRKGGKARKIHVRIRERSGTDGFGEEFEHAALVHVPALQKGEVAAVDERQVAQLCRKIGRTARPVALFVRRALEVLGRDARRAQLGDGLVQPARAARGVFAEAGQFFRVLRGDRARHEHRALLGEHLFAVRAAQKARKGGDGAVQHRPARAREGALRFEREPVLTENKVLFPLRERAEERRKFGHRRRKIQFYRSALFHVFPPKPAAFPAAGLYCNTNSSFFKEFSPDLFLQSPEFVVYCLHPPYKTTGDTTENKEVFP